jgi:hypothetical protein
MLSRLAAVALLSACDGGGDDAPPPPPSTKLLFDAADPCAAQVPSPTNLFRSADGKSELSSCPGPADPIERELFLAQIDEGTPTNSEILIPVEGTLDGATLTATATFALEPGRGGSVLPPLVMLRKAGTGSTAEAFERVELSASFDRAIRVEPRTVLLPGFTYFLIATDAIKDGERPQKKVVRAAATALLLGASPITAGADLDAATAARLERARQELAPVVGLLAKASPPIPADAIVSIQSFTTVPDPLARTQAFFDAYLAAVDEGRYPFDVTSNGGDIDPALLYPGLPPAAYQNILAFRRGTIRVPKVLGDDLRVRPGFPDAAQTLEIPFLLSIPRTNPYPVIVYLPGYGRSKLDARALANEFAGAPEAAVLALDLRCHGDRSPDANGCTDGRTAAAIGMLEDAIPNNMNPEIVGADGIPDASGQGFFVGDARALRDTQLATAIEILHTYLALRDANAFGAEGLSPDPNDLHVIAHGHSAMPALMASAFASVAPRTVQIPSGGAGFSELIFGGPDALEAAFVATLPSGIGADRAEEYVSRLEAAFLRSVSIEVLGPKVKERLGVGNEARRLLLNHPTSPSFVSEAARGRLFEGVPIPASRRSRHSPTCDDFYIFSCRLGIDDPTAPRQQITTFMQSNGVTVLPP